MIASPMNKEQWWGLGVTPVHIVEFQALGIVVVRRWPYYVLCHASAPSIPRYLCQGGEMSDIVERDDFPLLLLVAKNVDRGVGDAIWWRLSHIKPQNMP